MNTGRTSRRSPPNTSCRTESGRFGKRVSTQPASASSRTCPKVAENPVSLIAQHLLNGLMQVTIYGLVAIGFTIFFGVMNVIKFSHGDVMTFGAFAGLVAAWFADAMGLPVVLQLAFG